MLPTKVVAGAASAGVTPGLTPLRRFAAAATTTCAAQANAYGQCVLATYTDIRKDSCKAEFDKFGECMRQVVRTILSTQNRVLCVARSGRGCGRKLECLSCVRARRASSCGMCDIRCARLTTVRLLVDPVTDVLCTDEAQVVISPNSLRRLA